MIFYARKFLEFIVTLFLVTLVTFATFQILPGNPATAILGLDADDAQIKALETELHLDRPLSERYLLWLKGLLCGDLGNSYKYQRPVAELVRGAAAVTAELAFMSLIMACILGAAFGLLCSIKGKSPAVFALELVNQFWISTPSFCAAVLLIIVFAVKLHVFPSMGYVPFMQNPAASLKSLFLPALSLALGSGAVLARYLKTSLEAEQKKDYVRTLRAKGLNRRQILLSHTMRNSLIPVLTTLGMIVSEILGGSIIIENIFALPGIGRLVATSISSRDFPLLQSLVLYLAAITVLCNFLVDLLYSIIDPRIRKFAFASGERK